MQRGQTSDLSHGEGNAGGKSWARSCPAPGLCWGSQRHHGSPAAAQPVKSHLHREKGLHMGEECTEAAEHHSQGGDTHPFPPPGSILPHTPPNLPAKRPADHLRGVPAATHARDVAMRPGSAGAWALINTPINAKSSLFMPILTTARASVEHTPGPAQELRSTPGMHSIETTKQFSHKTSLSPEAGERSSCPGVGSLTRGGRAAWPWPAGESPTSSCEHPAVQHTPQKYPPCSVTEARAQPAPPGQHLPSDPLKVHAKPRDEHPWDAPLNS